MRQQGSRKGGAPSYKKMYDTISALADIGVWECSLPDEKLWWTDVVYDLFELPRGIELDRRQILGLYEPASRVEMERLRSNIIENGGSFNLDVQVRTALGNQRWIRLTAIAEQSRGKSVRIFGTKQDITSSKLAELELQSLQSELMHTSRRSAMSGLAMVLCHELNQPFSAISSYVGAARRSLNGKAVDPIYVSEALTQIEASALRAGAIIRSLRTMTEGRSKRRRENLTSIVREAISVCRVGLPDNVHVDFSKSPDDIVAAVEPVQLQLVIINLVKNAVEALESVERKIVTISLSVEHGQAIIQIADTGHGIELGTEERIFVPFFSSKTGGLGVGLSISRSIVEAHGGAIRACRNKAGGATFTISLPAIASKAGRT